MPRSILLFAVAAIAIGGAIFLRALRQPSSDRAASELAMDLLTSPAGPGSAEPNLAVAPDGRVYMSWIESTDTGHALRFSVLEGDVWSAVQTIREGSDFFVNWADFPSMKVLADGRLAVHWLQRSGSGTYAYGVRIAQSDDGGKTWTEPVMPHRDSSETEHGFVAMWPEDDGVGAAWLDGRNFDESGHGSSNEMMLMSTVVGPRGVTGDEVVLDDRTCDCCQNAVAVTAEGPIIAYRDRSPDEIRDVYVTRRIDGRWTPGVVVHADNWEISACPVNGPALAADGHQVAIAWFTAANDSARVKVAFSGDAGARFSEPIVVDNGAPAGRVDVALLPDGDALVTWIERIGGDTAAVRVRRVRQDGQAGASFTIASSSAARASGFPRIAISGSDVVFAWTVPGRPSAVNVARTAIAEIR